MSYGDLVLADRAVAYFPLDDASPAAISDASGNGYAASGPLGPIQAGGPAPFAGSGASMQFKGSENLALSATVGGHALADLPHGGSPFSYECWIQPIDNNLGGGNQGGGGLLFVRGAPGLIPNGTWSAWDFDSDPQGTAALHNTPPSGGGGGCASFTADLRAGGAWHHLVCTYDGAVGTIYLDGAPLALILPDTSGGLAAPFSATDASIGGELSAVTWSGNIAHAALYAAALRPCQVLAHYDLATTGSYTPCRDLLRLTRAPGSDRVRFTVPAGRTGRLVHHG